VHDEAVVAERTFETADGYGIVDIEGAQATVGPVRSAKKVLQRTTIDLIRHATYGLAIHQIDGCGAAAALNHDRGNDDQSPIDAFASELSEWAVHEHFVAHTGLGLGAGEIGPTLHSSSIWAAELVAASAAACVPPTAETVVIASDGDEPALRERLSGVATVSVEPDLSAALTSGADALLVRGKTGELHHDTLAETDVGLIIGLQPLTTTARGLAVAGRRGSVVVPDFISAAGPYLAALNANTERELVIDEVTVATLSVMKRLEGTDTAMFVRACELAEDHLRTWTSELPFGRPLAP